MPKTKEEKAEYMRKYRENNKDKLKQRRAEYFKENKERIREVEKRFWQSDVGKKSNRINTWKQRGLICDDYDLMYSYFINTKYCDNPKCKVELTEDKYHTETTRCLDHDHHTGEFRNVLCHPCNIKRR